MAFACLGIPGAKCWGLLVLHRCCATGEARAALAASICAVVSPQSLPMKPSAQAHWALQAVQWARERAQRRHAAAPQDAPEAQAKAG